VRLYRRFCCSTKLPPKARLPLSLAQSVNGQDTPAGLTSDLQLEIAHLL